MNILGISGAVSHDPSAAILVDGQLLAAAEEERFLREKHAKNRFPYHAARFCMEFAGVKPDDLEAVAFPYAAIGLDTPARWHYARRHWYAPDRALTALLYGNHRYHRNMRRLRQLLRELGVDPAVPIIPVEHHLAHASSAYHLSGFSEKSAILSIDGKGEYATTMFGYGEHGVIHKLKEFYDPDSLGGMYGALTEYLGFEMLDGEFKVMGMASYGQSGKYDFSRLVERGPGWFRVDNRLVNVVGLRRYKQNGKAYFFSPELVEWLGPPRSGDEIDEPYLHYAVAIQELLEECVLELVEYYLGNILRETGKLCFAGGVGLNVKLNQRLLALPYVKELFIQPAAGDAGTAVGAATYAAWQLGESIAPQRDAYLGPAFTTQECITACQLHPRAPNWRRVEDPAVAGAEILAAGQPLAWFQGRMEFGPRALGNRSILGDPSFPGIAERINAQIKYRERWRPFCPSLLDRVAPEILQSTHPAPYMTLAFSVAEEWKGRIPEVVHVDGTARAQVVSSATNPRYHRLISELERRRGVGVVLNTSLNRRGEPMVCTPADALEMFYGSDLNYLIMEEVLVAKQ